MTRLLSKYGNTMTLLLWSLWRQLDGPCCRRRWWWWWCCMWFYFFYQHRIYLLGRWGRERESKCFLLVYIYIFQCPGIFWCFDLSCCCCCCVFFVCEIIPHIIEYSWNVSLASSHIEYRDRWTKIESFHHNQDYNNNNESFIPYYIYGVSFFVDNSTK